MPAIVALQITPSIFLTSRLAPDIHAPPDFFLAGRRPLALPDQVLALYSLGSDASSPWQTLRRRGMNAELATANWNSAPGMFEERLDAARVGELDTATRYGGGQFALLMPDTSLQVALAVAERLRAAVEGMEVDCGDGQMVRLTISIGATANLPPPPRPGRTVCPIC